MCAAILVAIPKCNSRDVTEMFTTHDLLTILLEPDCPRSLVQVTALVMDEEVLLAFFCDGPNHKADGCFASDDEVVQYKAFVAI
jgi:hypothetical protein